MKFAVVKGELCSCSCNFVSGSSENRGGKGHISSELLKKVIINLGVQLQL